MVRVMAVRDMVDMPLPITAATLRVTAMATLPHTTAGTRRAMLPLIIALGKAGVCHPYAYGGSPRLFCEHPYCWGLLVRLAEFWIKEVTGRSTTFFSLMDSLIVLRNGRTR